jgi:tetratricopeptide (TPR) repeat protein
MASAIYRDGPRAAQPLADEALAAATQLGRPSLLVVAHTAQAQTRYFAGDLAGAREHIERALVMLQDEMAQLPAQSGDARISRRRVTTLTLAALIAWQVGHADEARRHAEAAVELAERARRPADRASVETNVVFAYTFLREPAAVREHVERAAAAETEAMARPSGTVMVFRGWAQAEEGQTREGIAAIRAGIERFSASGQRLQLELYLGLLADAYSRAGDVAEALRVLTEAEGAVPGEEVWRADTLRRRAELLARAGAEPAQVEATFRDALTVARRQGSRAYELRSATAYALFLHAHGRTAEARTLLAPVYGCFTEGFETHDLIEAKALLDELR